MKKFDLKSILIGVLIGIIGTTSVFFLIGDIDLQTKIQLGEKEMDADVKNEHQEMEAFKCNNPQCNRTHYRPVNK